MQKPFTILKDFLSVGTILILKTIDIDEDEGDE